jgi:hypothetical protein
MKCTGALHFALEAFASAAAFRLSINETFK